MRVRVIQSAKLGAERLVRAGDIIDLPEETVRRHPALFRSIEIEERAERLKAEAPGLAARARYEHHQARRAGLQAAEGERRQAALQLLTNQAKDRAQLAELAQQQLERAQGPEPDKADVRKAPPASADAAAAPVPRAEPVPVPAGTEHSAAVAPAAPPKPGGPAPSAEPAPAPAAQAVATAPTEPAAEAAPAPHKRSRRE